MKPQIEITVGDYEYIVVIIDEHHRDVYRIKYTFDGPKRVLINSALPTFEEAMSFIGSDFQKMSGLKR